MEVGGLVGEILWEHKLLAIITTAHFLFKFIETNQAILAPAPLIYHWFSCYLITAMLDDMNKDL